MRIAITGGPGVGKTTLVRALAAELGLPVVEEEMRSFLERGGVVAGRPGGEVRRALDELWRTRRARERAHAGFVADNASLDFAAYALHHGASVSLGSEGGARNDLVGEALAEAEAYDAVLLLPFGVLPYDADGVRPSTAAMAFRHHLIVEGLVRRHGPRGRTFELPSHLADLDARLRWALGVVASLPPRTRPAVPPPVAELPAPARGRVTLVGAGPGDPELLTVAARRLLETADVVAHDELVPAEILALVPRHVRLVPVGHRGRGDAEAPYSVHPAVVAEARAGRHVVRLKVGDPSIFGRGGEEVSELGAAGIAARVVPGVSAVLGAAAAAGIPLTHRDHASDVTLVTGHDLLSRRGSRTRWAALGAGTGTIALFMGARRLRDNLERLARHGRDPATPAAIVADATRPEQRVVLGTLGDLADRADLDPAAPALVIVGDVVRLAAATCRESAPLAGRRVLVGRARPGASAIAARLGALGASVLELPRCEAVGVEPPAGLARLLAGADDALVAFACGESVARVVARLAATGGDLRDLGRDALVAIGPAATAALAARGLRPRAATDGACAEGLAPLADLLRERRVVLVGHTAGRPRLARALEGLGARVEVAPLYRIEHEWPRFTVPRPDVVALPSSSAARLLLEGPLADLLRGVPVAAIGAATAHAARTAGAERVVCAADDSPDALVAEVIALTGGAGMAAGPAPGTVERFREAQP